MSAHLTAGQRAALRAQLELRTSELEGRLAARQQGLSRAEHASEVLRQDADDAPQREADREVDLALSDQDVSDLGSVSGALRRLNEGVFGLCVDCGRAIPFNRLKLEPQALRCVDCQSAREK